MNRIRKVRTLVFALVFIVFISGLISLCKAYTSRAGEEHAAVWGKDSPRAKTDRIGLAEGEIQSRSAAGSICTITHGREHYYENWFTREFTVVSETGTYMGYCVQPLSPPPSGQYVVSRLDNDVIKALLMMAPGYPYYESHGKNLYREEGGNTYAYAHAAMSYAYEGSLTGLSDAMQEEVKRMVRYAKEAAAGTNGAEIHENLSRFQVYIAYNDEQDVVWLEEVPKGTARLKKASACREITDGNLCYSVAGARYGVYTDAACKVRTGELVTDKKGESNALSLTAGKYYVRETEAPAGYALDPEVYSVNVRSGQETVLELEDQPQVNPVEILLEKYDSEREYTPGENRPQEQALLSGAEFTFRFYGGIYKTEEALRGKTPLRTWVFRTDERGRVRAREEYLAEGDPLWTNAEGVMVLPLGTLVVEETRAPEGYNKNPGLRILPVTGDGSGAEVSTFRYPAVAEEVIRGDLEIIKVYQPQGQKEDVLEGIEGVEFTITSDTTGEVVKKIVTDKEGRATTKDGETLRGALAYGSYTVSETRTPEGYNPIRPFHVTIREEMVTLRGIYRQDTLITSPIQVVKIDAGTGKVIPVSGTKFQLLDEQKQVVSVTAYYPSEQVIDVFETDESGSFLFPSHLAYGTYYLREIEAPKGYLLGGEDLKFQITEDSGWDHPLTIRYADENAMGRIAVQKLEKDSGKPIGEVLFEIRAAEDIVTPDGTIRMKKGELADTVTTGDGETFSDPLFLGKYLVREVRQKEGYALAEKEYPVQLEYEGQTEAVVTENVKIYNEPTRILLKKYEKISGKNVPLQGVKFEIWEYDMPDQRVEVCTDKNGQAELSYLKSDTRYCVQETEALEGYLPDTEVRTFTVDEHGRIQGKAALTIPWENKRLQSVKTGDEGSIWPWTAAAAACAAWGLLWHRRRLTKRKGDR